MISPTMPLLTIHHKTEYRYNRPVAFGEHRIMLRPRDGHDLRVLSGSLEIVPEPASLRWIHDVFGNSVAIATFDDARRPADLQLDRDRGAQSGGGIRADAGRSRPISIRSSMTTRNFPISFSSSRRNMAIPTANCRLGRAAFSTRDGATPTFDILSGMTHGIREAFTYRKRYEHGTQHPLDTLQTGSGTCRDYALFMIEALRRLGIAARFVSGYLFVPDDDEAPRPCRRRLDPCLGAGLSAQCRLDRVRSDQRHHRHPRSDSRRGGARSAPGDPAARHLSRQPPMRSSAWMSASTSFR